MFTFHIQKLHKQYGEPLFLSIPFGTGMLSCVRIGPIVRINPWELHVDDPEYYETIYGQSPPLDKLKSFETRFALRYASLSTADSTLHRTRRAALNPFMSARRIQSHEPLIQAKVDQVCDRLNAEYVGKEKELTLNDLFGCLAADVVMEIAFGHSYNLIAMPNFLHPFTLSSANTARTVHIVTHFPWVVTLTESLPESLLMAVSEQLRPIILYRRVRKLKMGNNSEIDSNRNTPGNRNGNTPSLEWRDGIFS